MAIIEIGLWIATGAIGASILWMFGSVGMASEAEKQLRDERERMYEHYRDVVEQRDRLSTKLVEACEERDRLKDQIDFLREALFRVHDVSRAWADQAEDA